MRDPSPRDQRPSSPNSQIARRRLMAARTLGNVTRRCSGDDEHLACTYERANEEGLHRRSLWEARAVHGATRAGSGLRGGGRVPGAKRGEARRVQGAHHRRSGSDERRRSDQEGGLRVRRGARRAGAARRPRLLDWNGPGGARPRASGRAPRVLVRVAHHPRRPGRVLVEDQSVGECRRPARALLARFADLDDQWRRADGCSPATPGGPSCAAAISRRGESQGSPVWSRHVGDPIIESNLTRRVDFALFMVEALTNGPAGTRGPGNRRLPDALGARTCRERMNSGLRERLLTRMPLCTRARGSTSERASSSPQGPVRWSS